MTPTPPQAGERADRADYWKQRAKAAEGHLWASDLEAAAKAVRAASSLTLTPWEELTAAQRFACERVAVSVIAAVNGCRDARRPKDTAIAALGSEETK